ncbi:hypothetical protein NQ317_008159 [Molorchus minor]|uniref:Protein TSSC1 n=1 Tax=Molorchus minor TaxID=1323400 RepID=A0ABQ9JJC0_9CUCU|nr:hypothetical protein NQ317_008159 [Molorchus minor]
MDNDNSVIYGLEFQQANNQIHLVEFNEEISTIKTSVYHHSDGEIWKITTSPIDSSKLATCYNSVTNESSCTMKSAILKLPETENPANIENLEMATKLDTSPFGTEVRTTDFQPTDSNKAASVTESHIILWDISESDGKSILNIQLEGKNSPKFTTGRWNPHQNCNQFTAATETHLKTYDIRTGELAWSIDGVHSQVWCVRFNHFHDQLILTASSDARVLISSAASVSSENTGETCIVDENDGLETKQILSDGPLQWCEHEDSVYCAEWSPAEPWVFASLSYDGRLLISRVKKSLKYQIML